MKTCIVVSNFGVCCFDRKKVIQDIDKLIKKGVKNFFVFAYGEFCKEYLKLLFKNRQQLNIYIIREEGDACAISVINEKDLDTLDFMPIISKGFEQPLKDILIKLYDLADFVVCYCGKCYVDYYAFGTFANMISHLKKLEVILYTEVDPVFFYRK